MQKRFSSAEGEPAAGGLEIQVVDAYFIIQFLWRILDWLRMTVPGLRIQAIAAAQGTAVQSDQRADASAVGAHTQAADPDDGQIVYHHGLAIFGFSRAFFELHSKHQELKSELIQIARRELKQFLQIGVGHLDQFCHSVDPGALQEVIGADG